MNSIRLAPLDWIVTIAYLAGIAVVGLRAGRHVKGTNTFFLGSRRFNRWLMIGQSFGTGTHAEMPVSLAGAVYSIGISGIWYQWKSLFVTPFYWLFAPIVRRFRCTTTGEVMESRYGPWLGAIYTVFALFFFAINMAGMLKGAAKVISQTCGGNVPVNALVAGMTAVFLVYSAVGGLVATAWTDLVQGFLILVLSFILVPLGWPALGGIAGMRKVLEPHWFSLATPHGIGLFFIAMLTLNGLVGILAQPHLIASVGTGKDEKTCRTGFLYGNIAKRFCTIGWALIGLMVAAMMVRGFYGVYSLADPEEAFGFACRHLLFPGGPGLLIASVLATNMAACSAFTVNSGALFTRNFYARYVARSASDAHYLLVGRISGVAIALLSAIYAVFMISRVLYSFLLTETLATFVGVTLLGGIVWPRANRWGALASLAASLSTNFVLYYIRGQRLDHWDPEVFLAAVFAGVVALVVVSLLTKPESDRSLRAFFGKLQTSSDDGEAVIAVEETSPVDAPRSDTANAGKQSLIVNLFHLRRGAMQRGFLEAYREDLSGFVVGLVLAIGIVLLAWSLFHF